MALESIINTAAVYQKPIRQVQSTEIKSNSVNDQDSTVPITITETKAVKAGERNNPENAFGQGGQNGSPTEKQLQDVLNKANHKLKISRTGCQFSYHEPTNTIQIKVIDEDSKEVIREIPSDQTLETIEKIWEIAGIIVDEKR